MLELFAAAKRLQIILDAADLPNCLIGGVAIQRWGEVRLTTDADAAVAADLGDEERVVDLLARHYQFRHPQPIEFLRVNRVLLLQEEASALGLDLSLAASGFEVDAIGRASPYDFSTDGSLVIRTCSAEDLVIYKAIANRDLDWHDIKGILIRQADALDTPFVDRCIRPLAELKEEPEIWDRWVQLRKKYL